MRYSGETINGDGSSGEERRKNTRQTKVKSKREQKEQKTSTAGERTVRAAEGFKPPTTGQGSLSPESIKPFIDEAPEQLMDDNA